MMKLSQSSYTNGLHFRPKPVVIDRPDSNLLVIATGWGPLEVTQKAAEIVVEQFELLSRDDVTTAFEVMASVSSPANRLVNGARMANQHLHKIENGKQWKAAVELTALHYEYGVLSWVHVGSPHVVLHDGRNVHPLAYAVDWVGQSENQGPLFSEALGMEANVNLTVGSLRLTREAQVLLVGRSTLPKALFQAEGFAAADVQRMMVDDDADAPYWLGLVDLDQPTARPVFDPDAVPEEEPPPEALGLGEEDPAA